MAKAKIKDEEGSAGSVEAQFNPKELSITKSVSWGEHKGAAKDRPQVQFTTGQPRKLKVDLFFDGYEKGESVRDKCETLLSMAEMDKNLHRPPECSFTWGEETFKGVVDNVAVKYTMFKEDGTAIRATVGFSMQNAKPNRDPAAEPTTSSPDFAKLHTLQRGETLHMIAAKEYDCSSEWRRIADYNGIDDPLSVKPGTKLLLPPIL